MELPYGANIIILTSTVLYDPSIWQTDRQADVRAPSIYAVCCRMLKTYQYHQLHHWYAIYLQQLWFLVKLSNCKYLRSWNAFVT